MQLVGTYTITTPGNLVLDSIPQTGTDLLIVFSGRETNSTAGGMTEISIFPGGTSAGVYKVLRGDGSNASSVATSRIGYVPNTLATANTFGNLSIYIPNYTSTTNKTVSVDSVSEQNATLAWQHLVAQSYTSTTPITFITMIASSGFAVGSSASVYLITKGSDGTTVVS